MLLDVPTVRPPVISVELHDSYEELLRQEGGNPLANTTWALQSLNVTQFPVGVMQTIEFSPASTVTGNGGCNQFNGLYVIGGQSLRIGPLATTSMPCEEAVATQEQAYLQALQSPTSYELSGNQLILRDGSGREVARFTRIG